MGQNISTIFQSRSIKIYYNSLFFKLNIICSDLPNPTFQFRLITFGDQHHTLGKTRSDRRGKVVKGGKQKKDDLYRIRIMLYLLEVKQQNKNQIQLNSKYGISTIEASRLKTLLLNMVEDNWIEQVKIEGVNHPVYKLTQRGLSITNFIKNLQDNKADFLLDLDCFANIKEIVSGDE